MSQPDVFLVDTHAHLDMSEFDTDRADVIRRAAESGIGRIITVGVDLESSRQAVHLAENNADIFATAGIHPHTAGEASESDLSAIIDLARHERIVAIGEIGLDYYRDYSPRDRQLDVLQQQLDAAARLELPVIIHSRQAHDDMLDILGEWSSRCPATDRPRGVIHCYMGDGETARRYLDMGFFLSLAGYISYPNPPVTHQVIREMPADRLMVETDCPFQTPQAHRGQRNEPSYVRLTAQTLADIRGVPLNDIARDTTSNARRLFQW